MLKKGFFLGLAALGALTSCNGSKAKMPDCTDVKTGTFKMYIDQDTFTFKRDSTVQIEQSPFGESEYAVRWITNCDYVLTLMRTTAAEFKGDLKKKYYIKIVEVKGNTYTYEYRSEENVLLGKNTAVKVD